MCGLVAVIQKHNRAFLQKDIEIFTQILFADEVRGSDGTGIFYNSKKGAAHTRTLKHAVPASTFIRSPLYEESCKILYNESNFVVGHNRSATKGKINNECTHPFREDHITLVHNGTIFNQKAFSDKVDVDSHAICYGIAKEGYKEVLKKIDGAFALIWFDAKERSLFVCRNIERPLFLIETSSMFVLVSEENMGKWIIERNKNQIIKSEAIKVGTVYKFNLPMMREYTEEKVDLFVPYTLPFKNHGGHRDFMQEEQEDYDTQINEFYKKKAKENLKLTFGDNYAFGETIRFMGGVVRRSHKLLWLEGDAFFKGTAIKEGKNKLKVFGTEEQLLKLALKPLVGKVSLSNFYNGITTYVVSDVKEVLSVEKHKELVEKEKDTAVCDWCGKDYPKDEGEVFDTGNVATDYIICPHCVAQTNSVVH